MKVIIEERIAYAVEGVHRRRATRAELIQEILKMREAFETLLPGLTLDLRYASPDDDRDALSCRIQTVREALGHGA